MIPSKPEPARPREIVCFKPFDFDTKEDGKIYMFFALDIYSHFLISTGGTLSLAPAEIMTQVNLLMQHDDFKKFEGRPFTLVMDTGEDILEELNLIAEPFQGTVVMDPDYISQRMIPEINIMLSMLKKGG